MPSSVQSSIKKLLSHFYMDVDTSLAFISKKKKKMKIIGTKETFFFILLA